MSLSTRRRARRRIRVRRHLALQFAELALAIALAEREPTHDERAVMRLARDRVRQALRETPIPVQGDRC
jgi:hypothetical protein